jgi:hypothetical protein
MFRTDFPIGSHVHVTDRNGELVYTRLIVSTPERMDFASGHGFVEVRDLAPRGWEIRDGWPPTRWSIARGEA